MVSDLEMPLHFSVSRIQRDHRTAEQIGAGPVTAVVIVRSWRVVRGVDDAALGIEGHRKTPLSGAGPILVTFSAPCLNAWIAGLLRDRAKFPCLRAGASVECTRSARISIRADDEKVLVNDWRGF